MKKLLWIFLLFAAGYIFFKGNNAAMPSGVIVPEMPTQSTVNLPAPFPFRNYTLTPLAHMELRARVLSTKRYATGREAELSPLDMALGWGRMSDSSVLDKIRISQSGRWYRWKTDHFPIPRREMETHSSNMHLIPADERVEASMLAVRKDDIIQIRGFLVRADAADGWRWISSLTREDTGQGACELIFVTSLTRE
ncbi:hypothetical protein OOT00_05305 [Desulfobotulus sp. H1]|uniref:Uncharacterized protein n=1 Tax=Desulfobotulus pelophilus TaxID=2823377 RepID=A0ABT3N7F9_9BACT|nr:hypothetical protein [Desulfobotulus pelophilus]MCW7753402.1 hypothetical protein [Desulfobotulus pelophilus]